MPATDVRTAPIRDDLCRSTPFTLTRATEGTDGLTIEGYGAVFNSVTRIAGWEGDFDEVIAPGAFRKSLRERELLMQFDHGKHPLLGSLPLGRWTAAEEDERGLHLVGRLTDNWLVQPFRDAIRDGGVKGMSFRFAVVRDEWTDAKGAKLRDAEVANLLFNGSGDRGPILRTLREVKATEAGPVVNPAYEKTAVGVRSRDGKVVIDLGQLHQPATQRQLADLVAYTDRLTGSRTANGVPCRCAGCVKAGPNGIGPCFCDQCRSADQTETVSAPPPDGTPTDPPEPPATPNEPQPTAPPADPHPAPEAAPEVTDRAAGEHSAPARPANPVERRELIRAEYRRRLKHVLALTQSSQNEKESA